MEGGSSCSSRWRLTNNLLYREWDSPAEDAVGYAGGRLCSLW